MPINNLLFHRVLSTKWMNGQEQKALDINFTAPALQILPAEVKGRCVKYPATEKFPLCYQMFITLLKKIKSRYVAFLTSHCESIWGRRFVTDINSLKMYWSPHGTPYMAIISAWTDQLFKQVIKFTLNFCRD